MYKWINNSVLGLIEVHKTNNIYELYDSLGIIIRKLNNDNILLQGNEAFYHRDFFENEIVFIKDDLNSEYEKFVLAHELAHAIIHPNLFTATYNKDLINIGKLERQANYFAIKLLDIKLDATYYEGFTIEQISSSLNIPLKCLNELLKEVKMHENCYI